jgi:hypothetical protein
LDKILREDHGITLEDFKTTMLNVFRGGAVRPKNEFLQEASAETHPMPPRPKFDSVDAEETEVAISPERRKFYTRE